MPHRAADTKGDKMHSSRFTAVHPFRRLVRLAAIGAIGLAILAGCSDNDPADNAANNAGATEPAKQSGTSTTEPRTKDSTLKAETTGDTENADPTNTDGGNAPATPAPSNPAPTPASAPTQPSTPPPVIVSFTTPESIDCHNGNFQQFTASWNVTGATEVTISIDGPGIYDTYPPVHEVSLPFTCPESHTFLLTAKGADGQTTTKQITLHSRNAQTQSDQDVDQD